MTTRTPLPPLQASDFTSAFPGSRKIYVEERGVRVPMREIGLTNGESLRVLRHQRTAGARRARRPSEAARAVGRPRRRGAGGVTQLHYARTRRDHTRDGVRRDP